MQHQASPGAEALCGSLGYDAATAIAPASLLPSPPAPVNVFNNPMYDCRALTHWRVQVQLFAAYQLFAPPAREIQWAAVNFGCTVVALDANWFLAMRWAALVAQAVQWADVHCG